jgi:hypothetical protein
MSGANSHIGWQMAVGSYRLVRLVRLATPVSRGSDGPVCTESSQVMTFSQNFIYVP